MGGGYPTPANAVSLVDIAYHAGGTVNGSNLAEASVSADNTVLSGEGSVTITASAATGENFASGIKSYRENAEGDPRRWTVTGSSITISSEHERAISARGNTVLDIGNESTQSISLATKDDSTAHGAVIALAYARQTGAKVNIKAQSVTITSDAIFGVHAGSNVESGTLSEAATTKVTIQAAQTTIKNKMADVGIGLSAYSMGQLAVVGNLEVEAARVIESRGHATVNINAEKTSTVKLKGDIVLSTDNVQGGTGNTSGRLLDANLSVNLTGADSAWEGRSFYEYQPSPTASVIQDVVIPLNNEYHGGVSGFKLHIAEGAAWTADGDSFVNTLTLSNGGKINAGNAVERIYVQSFKVEGEGNQLTLAKGPSVLNGTITMAPGAELITPLDTAFETEKADGAVTGVVEALTLQGPASGEENAKLTINDVFKYTGEGLKAMTDATASTITLNLTNATLAGNSQAELVPNIIQSNEETAATPEDSNSSNEYDTLRVDVPKNSGAQSLVVKDAEKATSDGKVIASGAILQSEAATTLTLVGSPEGGDLAKNSEGTAIPLTVGENVTLQLGQDEQEAPTKGTLQDITLQDGGSLELANIEASAGDLTAGNGSSIEVGSEQKRASLAVGKLDLGAGSSLFIDPAWTGSDTIEMASHVSADSANVAGNAVVGRNALMAVGTSASTAVAAFNSLAEQNGLAWGEGQVESAIYVATPITVASTGAIVVDGSLTSAPTSVTAGTVTIAKNALLMLDQSGIGSGTAFSGALLTLASGSTVGVVNATVGTIALADSVENGGATIVTDNPFIVGATSGSSLVLSMDADNGLGALASTGIQAMMRRADTILAQTIADRTALDRALTPGANLWVDVTGERYEADSFKNNGKFRSDMAYGAFGADFDVADTVVAGTAIQFGKGKLRSGVASIKNDIENYGITAYASKSFGASKLVGEVAYVRSENKITSSQKALGQKVDSEIYSLGVRGQHQFTAGNFAIIPSVGVRVSEMRTDAMKVGAVKVAKQKQTLVQTPISLRIVGNITDKTGWVVAPSAKLSFVPTFGDKEIKVLGYKQTVIDTSPVQADFGLIAQKGNLQFNATGMIGGGKNGTSSVGGKVGMRYAF